MDIIHKDCPTCDLLGQKYCYNCSFNLPNRIKEQLENKGIVDITTTNTTYHFTKKRC